MSVKDETQLWLEGSNTKPNFITHDEDYDAKHQQVAILRDAGKSSYINGVYRESVCHYTEAVGVHTNGFHSARVKDETLATLYGDRAAALMMIGAYEGAHVDCIHALQCNGITSLFRSQMLCRMAGALLKAGNIWEADKKFHLALRSAKETLPSLPRYSSRDLGSRRESETNHQRCYVRYVRGKSLYGSNGRRLENIIRDY